MYLLPWKKSLNILSKRQLVMKQSVQDVYIVVDLQMFSVLFLLIIFTLLKILYKIHYRCYRKVT